MPVITLQVGQCGNQVGQHLWKLSSAQLNQPEAENFFSLDSKGRLHARCVAIDTEPKVVNQLLLRDDLKLFKPNRIVTSQSGCGNNWAYGYLHAGCKRSQITKPKTRQAGTWRSDTSVPDQQPAFLDKCLEAIRRENEAVDGAADFLLLHSLAGGTGSGLGSRILEELRNDYSRNHITCASILPSSIGDTAMHALNCTMSLSFLQAYSDAVLLYNDPSVAATQYSATNCASVTPPWEQATRKTVNTHDWQSGLGEVNGHIARTLLGALWPLNEREALGGMSRMNDLVANLAESNSCKFLEAGMVWLHPNTPHQAIWMDGFRGLCRVFPRYEPSTKELVTCTGALVIGRGCSINALGGSAQSVDAYLKYANCHVHPKQLPTGAVTLRSASKPLAAVPLSKPSEIRSKGEWPSLTAVCKRSSVVPKLERAAVAASKMHEAGAYMHWFERWGCSGSSVEEACEHVLSIAEDYQGNIP